MIPEVIKCVVCNGRDKKCVACKGVGKIKPPKPNQYIKDIDGKMSKGAKKLRARGYTLREIASILRYKHPQSVQHLLNKKQ